MAEEMVPDQIMKALDFAEFVMAKEKKDRVGSSDSVVLPMKFFFCNRSQLPGHSGPLSWRAVLLVFWRGFFR